MNIQTVAYLLNTIGLLVSLYLIFRTRPQTLAKRYFLYIVASITFWVICNAVADLTSNPDVCLLFSRIAILGPLVTVPAIYLFIRAFPYNEYQPTPVVSFFLFLPFLATIPFTNTTLNIISVTPTVDGWTFQPGALYPILGVLVVIFLVLIIKELAFKYSKAEQRERYQLNFLFSSLFLTIAIALIFTLLLPIAGLQGVSYFGPLSSLIFIFSTLFIITTSQFLDISIILSQILRLFIHMALFFLLFLFFQVIILNTSLIDRLSSRILFSLFTSLLAAFLTLTIFDKTTNLAVFGSRKRLNEMVLRINNISSRILSLDNFCKETLDTLDQNLILRFSFIRVTPSEKNNTTIQYPKEVDHINKIDMILENLSYTSNTFTLSFDDAKTEFLKSGAPLSSQQGRLISGLRDNNIGFISRTITGNGNVLVLVLSTKSDNNTFSPLEIDIIKSILPVLSTAVDRSILYEESRDFARTLQQKVDNATKELTERNKELEELYKNLEDIYRKEKDLMDIAGHEFRTPASILKNNLYLLKKRLSELQKGKSDEKVQKYLDRLVEGTDRQIKLVDTFLESARIDNQRFEIQVEMTDITEMVKTAVSDMKPFAQQKNLAINYNPPFQTLKAEVDKVRIREVLDNLLNNAVKYTKQGSITTSLTETEKTLRFSVKDTGIGIKPEDQALLFKKFSRVDNYIGGEEGSIVRPGGTGLGLFVAKTIIDSHGGRITVESTPNVGSTFTIEIPKIQPSYVKRVQDIKTLVFKTEPQQQKQNTGGSPIQSIMTGANSSPVFQNNRADLNLTQRHANLQHLQNTNRSTTEEVSTIQISQQPQYTNKPVITGKNATSSKTMPNVDNQKVRVENKRKQ